MQGAQFNLDGQNQNTSKHKFNNNKKPHYNNNYKKNFNNYGNNDHFNKNSHHFTNKFDNINAFNGQMGGFQYGNPMINPMINSELMQLNNNQIQFSTNQEEDVSSETLDRVILESISYYFSEENLNKDLYMRKLMDENGYVDINQVAGFNRMQKHRVSAERIADVLSSNNSDIEINTSGKNILLRNKDWSNLKNVSNKLFTLRN